jgi:hypothetical protein
MDAKEYRRWALDGLREQARARGILVSGRKDEPRLLLRQDATLSILYQERWWRSAFKRSGYGGSLLIESHRTDEAIKPTVFMLVNLGEFFISVRSPETTCEIDRFLDRLVQLADWCVNEKLAEILELAEMSEIGISKAHLAATLLREFSSSVWANTNGGVS